MNNIPDIAFKSTQEDSEIEFLELSDLFLRIEKAPNHNPRKPHRINFNALLIVTKGEGSHQVDLKTYPLQKDSVIKIAKGQVHAFQDTLLYEGYLVVFTEDFVMKHFSKSSTEFISHFYNYHISEPLIKNATHSAFFLKIVMEELKNKKQYAKKEIIAKMLELYLLQLERNSYYSNSIEPNKNHQSLFLSFKTLVENKYVKTRNVKDYAAYLNITTKHLNHITKEITLNTAKSFIDQYSILEIKRAILSSNNSLKEIAYQVGFEEVTNFTKFFKKRTGYTPKEFKSSLRL